MWKLKEAEEKTRRQKLKNYHETLMEKLEENKKKNQILKDKERETRRFMLSLVNLATLQDLSSGIINPTFILY